MKLNKQLAHLIKLIFFVSLLLNPNPFVFGEVFSGERGEGTELPAPSNKPTGGGGKAWCWTKSMANDDQFRFKEGSGGMNWGYCSRTVITKVDMLQSQSSKRSMENKEKVDYMVLLKTPCENPDGSTLSSLLITIIGDDGESSEEFLSEGIECGMTEYTIKSFDVGYARRIRLRLEGSYDYQCEHVTVIKGSETTQFDCMHKMNKCKPEDNHLKCIMELNADGNSTYRVQIKSSNDVKAELYYKICGSDGISEVKLLSAIGMKTNEVITKKISSKNIGDIRGFKLQIGSKGSWKPVYVKIESLDSFQERQFRLGVTIDSERKKEYSHNCEGNEPEFDENGAKVPMKGETKDINEEFEGPKTATKDDGDKTMDVNDPLGGLMCGSSMKSINLI